jgi:uncharacterized membrane protein YphA (DoxX/SURF4 family)
MSMNFCHNKSVGLLIIRVAIGALFALVGWMKVSDMTNTVLMFAQMGIPAYLAYIAAYTELLGGISLILGYGSKIASALLAVTMAVAAYEVRTAGFMMMALPLTLLAVALGLMFTGPGKYSLGSSCGCPCKEGTCPVTTVSSTPTV